MRCARLLYRGAWRPLLPLAHDSREARQEQRNHHPTDGGDQKRVAVVGEREARDSGGRGDVVGLSDEEEHGEVAAQGDAQGDPGVLGFDGPGVRTVGADFGVAHQGVRLGEDPAGEGEGDDEEADQAPRAGAVADREAQEEPLEPAQEPGGAAGVQVAVAHLDVDARGRLVQPLVVEPGLDRQVGAPLERARAPQELAVFALPFDSGKLEVVEGHAVRADPLGDALADLQAREAAAVELQAARFVAGLAPAGDHAVEELPAMPPPPCPGAFRGNRRTGRVEQPAVDHQLLDLGAREVEPPRHLQAARHSAPGRIRTAGVELVVVGEEHAAVDDRPLEVEAALDVRAVEDEDVGDLGRDPEDAAQDLGTEVTGRADPQAPADLGAVEGENVLPDDLARGSGRADSHAAEVGDAADPCTGQAHRPQELGPVAAQSRAAQVFPDLGAGQVEMRAGILRPADAGAPEADLPAYADPGEHDRAVDLGAPGFEDLAEEVAADGGVGEVQVASDPDAAEVGVPADLDPREPGGPPDLGRERLRPLAEEVACHFGDLEVQVSLHLEAVEADLADPRLAEGEGDAGVEMGPGKPPHDLELVEVVADRLVPLEDPHALELQLAVHPGAEEVQVLAELAAGEVHRVREPPFGHVDMPEEDRVHDHQLVRIVDRVQVEIALDHGAIQADGLAAPDRGGQVRSRVGALEFEGEGGHGGVP